MIVADSSVWIDHFHGKLTPQVRVLRGLLSGRNLLVGDLILHEVARGKSDDAARREVISFMRRCRVAPMLNTRTAIRAAHNFQRLRKAGVTPLKRRTSSSRADEHRKAQGVSSMCKVEVDAELLKEAFVGSGFATEREMAEEGLRMYVEWRKVELQMEAMQKPITDEELDDLFSGRWRPPIISVD